LVVHLTGTLFNLAIGKLITFDCEAPAGATWKVGMTRNSQTANAATVMVTGNGNASAIVTVSGAAGKVIVHAGDASSTLTFTLAATAPVATPAPATPTPKPPPTPPPAPTPTPYAGPATPNPYMVALLASGGTINVTLYMGT